MGDELDCKTGLEKGIIDKDIFDKETALCGQLYKENGGKCGWGVCETCGVIPLLHKLYEGKLLENPDEIKRVKGKIFNGD